jgi:hypothetical protein
MAGRRSRWKQIKQMELTKTLFIELELEITKAATGSSQRSTTAG